MKKVAKKTIKKIIKKKQNPKSELEIELGKDVGNIAEMLNDKYNFYIRKGLKLNNTDHYELRKITDRLYSIGHELKNS